eukprot:CFRG2749T1
MPLSVEEYRVAQRYMIAKKSLTESQNGEGGVEIIENKPYTDGPGGSGQYTFKKYHLGSNLPSWIASLMPKNALEVHEEGWNAYPYTKTMFSIPFVNKFHIDIETVYKEGNGTELNNALDLNKSDLSQREVININILTTKPVYPSHREYNAEEDPLVYVSKRTSRGPLCEGWENEHKPIMCAYKVCRVNFKYWGLQGKLENFIADVGLKRTIVSAHRQAWCWQDEWVDLTIDDVLVMEREAQRELALVFAQPGEWNVGDLAGDIKEHAATDVAVVREVVDDRNILESTKGALERRNTNLSILESIADRRDSSECLEAEEANGSDDCLDNSMSDSEEEYWLASEKFQDDMSTSEYGGSFDTESPYRDELSDTAVHAHANKHTAPTQAPLKRNIVIIAISPPLISTEANREDDWKSEYMAFKRTVKSVCESHYSGVGIQQGIEYVPLCGDPLLSKRLALMLRGLSKSNETINTCPSALTILAVSSPEYDAKLQAMVHVWNNTMQPFVSFDRQGGSISMVCDRVTGLLMYDILARPLLCDQLIMPLDYFFTLGVPIGLVLTHRFLLAMGEKTTPPSHTHCTSIPTRVATEQRCTSLSPPQASVAQCSLTNTHPHMLIQDRHTLKLPRCRAFLNVFHSADPLGYRVEDAMLRTSRLYESEYFACNGCMSMNVDLNVDRATNCLSVNTNPFNVPLYRRFPYGCDAPGPAYICANRTTGCSVRTSLGKLKSPSISSCISSPSNSVLAGYTEEDTVGESPGGGLQTGIPRNVSFKNLSDSCPTDLSSRMNRKYMNSSNIPSKTETALITQHPPNEGNEFLCKSMERQFQLQQGRMPSVFVPDSHSIQGTNNCLEIPARMDYELESPNGVNHMTPYALLWATQGSYWTSEDFAALFLRQVVPDCANNYKKNEGTLARNVVKFTPFVPSEAVTSWLKSRSRLVVANGSKPHHRARDVLVKIGRAQVLKAKFSYGNVYSELVGEQVEVFILSEPPHGKWRSFGTVMTVARGKATIELPDSGSLPVGNYPVTFLVKADHTIAECQLVVVKPKTEVVIFSVDGAFAANFSMSGTDPKVQAMSVDVVRAWSAKGYLIVYISSRPDMQYFNVVNWLGRHNFPFGSVHICGAVHARGRSAFKGHYIKRLVDDNELVVCAAYGSAKDISSYKHIQVPHKAIYIHGKGSLSSSIKYLPDGFTVNHLEKVLQMRASMNCTASKKSVSIARRKLDSLALKPSSRSEKSFAPRGLVPKISSFSTSRRHPNTAPILADRNPFMSQNETVKSLSLSSTSSVMSRYEMLPPINSSGQRQGKEEFLWFRNELRTNLFSDLDIDKDRWDTLARVAPGEGSASSSSTIESRNERSRLFNMSFQSRKESIGRKFRLRARSLSSRDMQSKDELVKTHALVRYASTSVFTETPEESDS